MTKFKPLRMFGSKIPKVALFLGVMGATPFVFLSVSLQYVQNVNLYYSIFFSLNTYAAIILSFLGGVSWGVIMSNTDKAHASIGFGKGLCISIVPSLVGWLSLFLEPTHSVNILCVMFFLVFYSDLILLRKELLPKWYFQLRCLLTGIVISTLIAAKLSSV